MKVGKAAEKSYLVEVAPISKSSLAPTLSYFSGERIAPGTLARVRLRAGTSLGLVLNSRDVRSAKTEIRRAGFLLKKIAKRDITRAVLSKENLSALYELSSYYALPLGTLLAALMPKMLLEEPEIFFAPPVSKKSAEVRAPETLLLQMEDEERFGQYRALVRQAFARGSSVMFIVPSNLEIARVKAQLSKGIEDFTYTFSLDKKKALARTAWIKALKERHPILFITTPSGLFFSRADLDTLILERENSRAYRRIERPYLNSKKVVETLARTHGRELILGDSLLSLETLRREKERDSASPLTPISEESLIRWRLRAIPTTLVDASSRQNKEGRFEIFTPELKDFIKRALEDGGRDSPTPGRIFLFGARKGLAPTTVCGDCGQLLPCQNCGAPVVLHRRAEANIYICHACLERRESTTTCGYCGSWRLVPLGIGTEEIALQARSLFPQTPVKLLDKDSAPTDKQAIKLVQEFEIAGGIMVGTELAFYHLRKVPYSALVSVDALFSVPDFSIHERIFYLISRLREMTQKESMIQTRNIGKQILAWAAQGLISDFYQSEIEERKALLYPPFSLFIKVSALNKEAFNELPLLKNRLMRWRPDIFKDSLIIRLEKEAWPDPALLHELTLLGRDFGIKVDPESIL